MHEISRCLPSPQLMEGGYRSAWLVVHTLMSMAVDLLTWIHSSSSSVLQSEQGDTVKGRRLQVSLNSIEFAAFLNSVLRSSVWKNRSLGQLRLQWRGAFRGNGGALKRCERPETKVRPLSLAHCSNFLTDVMWLFLW